MGLAPALDTELLLQDAVLLAQILDHRILLASDPAGERGYQDLPGLEDGCHPWIVVQSCRLGKLSKHRAIGVGFLGTGFG